MSSVGNVQGNKQTSDEGRARAESTRRENELNRKHQAEISNLQKEHAKELQKLQAEHEHAVDEYRVATKEAITDRDIKYQQEMEEIRKLNRERVTNLTNNYEERVNRQREESGRNLESERSIDGQQKKLILENFRSEMKHKDKLITDISAQAREDELKGMEGQRNRLLNAHETERRALTGERNETVGRLQEDLRQTNKMKNEQEKELNKKLFNQKSNLEDRMAYEVSRERRVANDQHTQLKSASDMAMDDLRKRYTESMRENSDRNRDAFTQLSNDVSEREEGHSGHLERRLREAEDSANRRVTETRRLDGIEKKDLLESMRNNLNSSEKNRQESVIDSNRRHANDILEIQARNSKILNDMHSRSQEQIGLMKVQHEQELGQKVGLVTNQLERVKTETDLKDVKRDELFNRDRKFLADYYDRNLEALKEVHDQTVYDTREKSARERNLAVGNIEKQMRENEAKALQRMELSSVRHDKEINDLKVNQIKEMDVLRRAYETRIKNDGKLAQQNLDSQKLKYENQISAEKESYEERIRQLQKNFEAEKINWTKAKT